MAIAASARNAFFIVGTFEWNGGISILPTPHYNSFQAAVPQGNGSVLTGIQQHPDLLALLASDDTHECRSASHAGIALFRLSILHRACADQR
jgi:hypothetical protein